MSAPTVTNPDLTIVPPRAVDEEIIDLYTEDAATLGAARSASIAGRLAAFADTFLVGEDRCDTGERDAVMATKIQQAYELIETLPCLCISHEDDPEAMCRRCQAIGNHTPHPAAAKATATSEIVAQTLVQQRLFADVDSARAVASVITMVLWQERKLVGSDPIETAVRDENQVLHQRLATITRKYNEVDRELCEACTAMVNGGPCPFHTGHTAGSLYLAEAIGAICDDIELADRIHQTIADRDA